MPLTKLDNLISSKTGRYLYVSPDDFNASDALDNRGNSPTRPFLTIQRAFLEVARYSYVPGQENDRFDQFTIMLSPGNHYIDNRPGVLNPLDINPFGYDQAKGEWTDNSIVDLSNPDNILYKFNGPNGGATIPRGTSLVGMDLRRTRLHPLYVPDPADKDIGRTTLFNVTGGCYFWQFTILDGDVERNSPLYDEAEGIGKVYSQPNSTVTQIPYYSHHKICNFEFADKEDLGLLYRKIARAFSLFQPTIDDPGEFTQRPQENRIVGPLQDAIRIDSITVNNVAGTTALDVTVRTKTNHGYYVGQAVAIANLRSTLPAGATEKIPLANDPLTGVFAVKQISFTDPKEFTYRVEGKNAAAVGLGDKIAQPISPPDLDTNAITQAEVDSVESASPYVFNVSIRSTWGICGIHADGSKATGFKSMVIAQYTGVSLQRDDRAFIRYDEFSNTWNQAPLTDAFATTPYHAKGDAYWKDDWRNFHVKASNDAFIQNVSIFAVGFADHFLMESGGDMSITNSNSNFGNTSLHAIGYKGYSFSQDQGGYISHIIPPKKVTTTTKKYQYYTFNQIKSRNNNALNFDGPGGTSSITTKLYFGNDEATDPFVQPSTIVNGFRLGARAHEKIYVKLDPAIGFNGSIRSAELTPCGYQKWSVALSILSPTESTGVSNNDQDAANLIDLNRNFIAAETYGYITRKYPYLLTKDITISKCKRDVGYVLEAISNDLRVGGNANSVQAGQAYYIGTNLDYIDGEKTESIEAFNYARNLAIAAMRNWNFYINGCTVGLNSSVVTVPSGITTIGIVEGMKVTALPVAGQTNPIPEGTYVREIISTTQFRLGNRNDSDEVKAIATISGTGVKLNFELSQGKFATSSGRAFDAATLITLNKDFIANEALILAKAQYPTTTVPNDDKCKRDIGYVLDAVVQDLKTTGNAGIVTAAESYVGAPSRYFDAKNLILQNKREIVDKAVAKIAIDYPDFYFGGSTFTNISQGSGDGDDQTNVYSRYKDSYRLIQQNKREITEKAIAQVAIEFPDFYFPGDATSTVLTRRADSYRLIQQNKTEIVETAYNAIATAFPTFTNPNPAKCRRDIGYFIDAVSTDIWSGGNYYTREFIKFYYTSSGQPIQNGLDGEEAQSKVAFEKARDEMKKAISNQLTIKDLTITVDTTPGSQGVCTNIKDTIDTLVGIVAYVLDGNSINSIPSVSYGTLTAGGNKCLRDVGYFVDAISTDLTTLGNSYSIDFIKQYFVQDKVNGKILTFTNTSGTTLSNRQNRTYTGVSTVTTGNGKNATFTVSRDAAGAVSSVTLLSGGHSYLPTNTLTIKGSSIGGLDVTDDITVTVSTIETAWITAGLQNEEQQSLAVFTKAVELCKKAITNQLYLRDTTLTGDPNPGSALSGVSVFGTPGTTLNNDDPQSCSNVQATLDTLANIIFARIRQGDLVTGTTTNPALPEINYGGAPAQQAKCKRDVGYIVDAIANDLALGGNYNIIRATKAYFDNTGSNFISNGLVGEIPQSIAAFSAAQELCKKAITNQLNYRDLQISTGPENLSLPGVNVPNTSPNACADVRDAIDNLFGILINKLQSPNAQYPILAYNAGASSLSGELDISVYAFKKVRDLAILAMRNWRTGDGASTDPLYAKQPSNNLNISVDLTIDSSTAGLPVCADVAYTISTEFDILLDSLLNAAPLPPKNYGSDAYIERETPQVDTSIINDTTTPENKCAGTKDAIIEKMRVVTNIIENGVDAEPLVSQLVNTSSFAKRATLFTVAGSNPHNLETGTPVRLVAVPRKDTATGNPVNVDKRLVRLPKGFEPNKTYYVIAPGRITSPENYSAGGVNAQFNNTQTFMLATSIENATAGNYIYSSETDGIDPDVQIEIHQYLTHVDYDLHRYTSTLVSSRVFETTTNNVFDTGFDGVEVQKVYFYPLQENLVNGTATGAALNTLPAKTSGGRLEINRFYYVGRPATYTKNNQFSIYLTVADAVNKQNAVQFNFPSGERFHVFANKKRSPLGYDPVQTGWFLKTLLTGNEIYERITLNDVTRGSSYVNKPARTPDSFFYRYDDDRKNEDKIYKFRYVIPNYRDDVRDPINGFVIKIKRDETRRLVPQKILLKPVSQNTQKDAIFFESGVQNPKRLGLPSSSSLAAVTYDPYNPTNRTRIPGNRTSSNISFTIQSAKKVGDYIELTVFDHGLDVESLKAKRFVTVKVSQPQGGNGIFLANKRITWRGDYTGSAIVHSWFGSENVEGSQEIFNYLILKDVEGELDFDEKKKTTFTQEIENEADVVAEIIDRPNFGKEDKKEYLYGVEASNVYTVTPGDVITDDSASQYRVVSVEDVEDLTNSYYIYGIEEIQRRIPRQQDGIYYLTALRGDISPYPTGSGVGENFRKFKFSQPVSRLYPLAYKNDPLLFQYDGSDAQGGNSDITILDPPSAFCAADNYIHGQVFINDAKNSLTKELVLDFIQDPGSGNYEYQTSTSKIEARSGSAASGAEERLIPIAGDSQFPLEQKLYVELRRPSIARAGNHTFEYLGFGPGNYSTGFPARQTVILTATQDFYAQAKKQDAGIVFYTGINSNGELYIGNKKINAITGKEEFIDAVITDEDAEAGQVLGSLVTVFEDPVTFENIITLNSPPNLKNFFNSPIEMNVDPEYNAAMTPPSLRIVSRPGSRLALLPGDDDPQLDTTKAGDIILDKNRVRAAIFDMNTRGTQRYSFRTGLDNKTPNQDTVGLRPRISSSQTLNFGSSVPLSGDVILKGAEVGFSGSIGWIYANTFTPYRLTASAGQEASIDITGVQLYPNLNVIKLIFQTGKINFSSSNPGSSLNIKKTSQIRITGGVGRLSVINGVHTVYDNPTEGYEYLESNGYVYLLTTRASEATLVGSPPYINSVLPEVQPTIQIAIANSQWKEVGVVGAEALRTKTDSYGDYRLGINTVSRANSSAWTDAYVNSTTDPRATLDVVGNAFISGKLQSNFSDLATFSNTNKAFIVGGDSNNTDVTATFRISTVPIPIPGSTTNTTGGRIGINVGDGALDRNFVISGDARITGDFKFETDIDVNGGDIRSTATTFTIANQSSTTTLSLAGFATTFNIGNSATATQTLNIGNASSAQTLNIGTGATGQTRINIHTTSSDSEINLATVANNNNTYKSRITIGGAYARPSDSIFRVKNYQSIFDGNLELRGDSNTGILTVTTQSSTVNLFPNTANNIKIGSSSGSVEIGGVAGESVIRNGLRILGKTTLESDVIQNGGNRNSSVGVVRNILGTIEIASVSRNNNVATITTIDDHSLSNGNTVSVRCSEESFETVTNVTITVTGNKTFTYSNTGANLTTTTATGVVLNNIGLSQVPGSLADLNVDYYQYNPQIAPAVLLSTVSSNKILVSASNNNFFTGYKHYFTEGNAVKFTSVGNLSNVNTSTTYYIKDKDEQGFTLSTASDLSTTHVIGLVGTSTDAGNAAIILSFTSIDIQGSGVFSSTETTLEVNNPQGINNGDLLLIGTEIVKTTTIPSPTKPYTVTVIRGQDNTQPVAHADNTQIVKLIKQENAAFIFPNPVTAVATNINLSDFTGTFADNDILRLNKGTAAEEFVRINAINTADAQSFVITDGNFGTVSVPLTPKTTFSVTSTTGDTFALGDVTIGYDDGVNSSTATGSTLTTTGGGNLKVHNSIELSGNTDTSNPGKQYFVITNGTAPKFYIESASGDTKLYDGADLRIFKDSFYTSGTFDKGRIDGASSLAFEVLGSSGNTKIAGTLNVGDDFTIENGLGGTDTFTVDAQTGDTYIGRHLRINGASSASPSAGTVSLEVTNLGISGGKPFKIKQDASIDAFGKVNFYNKNGGRRTVYISNTSGTVTSALVTNVNYLIRPTSNLTVNLPSNAETGDVIRFVDFGGALKFNVTLIINAPAGVSVQGNQDGGFGQLLVNTPNAAFGLIYVGEYDSDGTNQIPSDNRGWWLMEV